MAAASTIVRVVFMVIVSLEPSAKADDESRVVAAFKLIATQIGGATESAFVDDADVGRKFAGEFVAQAQAGLAAAQARADSASRVVLSEQVHFHQWLQHPAVRQKQFLLFFLLVQN